MKFENKSLSQRGAKKKSNTDTNISQKKVKKDKNSVDKKIVRCYFRYIDISTLTKRVLTNLKRDCK